MTNLYATEILNSIDDLFYVVVDNDQNIMDFKNSQALEIYKNFMINSICIGNNNKENSEYFLKKTKMWYEYSESKIDDGKTIKLFRDITKFKVRERSLQIDDTTGLANRSLTNSLVNECIKSSKENMNDFAVIFGDIDFFKLVNDVHGHDCGDTILKHVGSLIRNKTRQINRVDYHIRPLDIAGRYGGEEFLIVLRDISKENVFEKAEFLRKTVEANEVEYDGKIIKITMSLGVYHVDADSLHKIEDIDEFRSQIMHKADLAMYDAKKSGRNKVVVYNNDYVHEDNRVKVRSF